MGAAMGWTVHDVKRASVWEFFAALEGYVQAKSPKEGNKLSDEDKDELWDWMERLDAPSSMILSTQTYRLDGARLVPAGMVSFEA